MQVYRDMTDVTDIFCINCWILNKSSAPTCGMNCHPTVDLFHHSLSSGNVSRSSCSVTHRVRTILVLGYWVLGNIHTYWVVLVLGGYILLFWHPIQYRSDNSRHRPHASQWLVSSTCNLYSDRCNRLSGQLIFYSFLSIIIVISIDVWDFLWSLLCYTLLSVLVLGIGITTGQ